MIKVLHYVSIMNRAGEETFIMNVFRTIDKKSIMFDFLCTINKVGDYDEEIKEMGGNIFCLEQLKFKTPIGFVNDLISLYIFLKMHSKDYNVFHVHTQQSMDGYFSGMVAKIAGISKVIIHSHTTSTLYHPILHSLFRPLLGHSSMIKLACSDMAGQWLFGKKSKYKIICNGIDSIKFLYSKTVREEVRLKNDWIGKKIVGHVGSFTYPKNHIFLLEIFKELHNIDSEAYLVLIGRGENADNINQYIKENNLTNNVSILGVRDDVNKLYQGMDLFLFPSKYEGLGIVLVEAQAAALPCLISDVIPDDVNITEYIYRLSLNASASEWAKIAKQLIDKNAERRDTFDNISQAGYDVAIAVKALQKIYTSSCTQLLM